MTVAAHPPTPFRAIMQAVGVVALQYGISVAASAAFSARFGFGYRQVALHAMVVGALYLFVWAALGIAARTAAIPSRWLARFCVILHAALFVSFAALYTADFVSTAAWGRNVTVDLAWRYLTRPALLVDYLGLVTDWLVAGLGLLAVAGWVGYLATGAALHDGVRAVRTRPLRAVATWPVACGVAATAIATLLVLTLPTNARWTLVARDPVLGFFVDAGTVHRFALSRLVERLRVEGPEARRLYPKPAVTQPANVVLVVVDSLRADHTSAYGYARATTPFLDEWIRRGTLRRVNQAFASCPESGCGISSLLASKTLGSLLPENFTLPDLLHDQGYDVNIIASGDHDWYGLKEFYGDGVTRYIDGTMSKRFKPTDDRVVLEGLESVPAAAGTPAFFYLHLMSAHALGVRQEPFARFQPTRANAYWGTDTEERINGYDNGVIQADAILREAFTTLELKGYLKNAVVVITSDHGEGLVDRGGRRGLGHGQSLNQEFLRIPFLVGDTSGRPLTIRATWGVHVDVAPTIVDRLGLPVPTVWEGQSLIALDAHRDSFHYADRDDFPSYAIVAERGVALFKYVVQSRERELFDLLSDPDEQRNLLPTADARLVQGLREALENVLSATER